MKPVIRFTGVSKRFGRVVALEDVSLQIQPGTVCALLGANGAGKSTAIRLMLGFETPDKGDMEIMQMNPKTHALEIRGRVGYVSDAPPLYDWMTVQEIGWFAAGFYPTGYQQEYDKLTKRFDLVGSQRIKGLSKGTRAKVALSLAMAHRPPLLIMDEPTSGLDPLVRREFLESMIDVAAEGRSVLLSSHQVGEVERVADDVIVLMNGRVVAHERLEDLKKSVTEVVLSLPSVNAIPPAMPGNIVAHVPFGDEHVWLVRDLDAGRLADLCRTHELPEPVIRKPSLEDILLTLLRQNRNQQSNESRPAVPVPASGGTSVT
jgi:ABC-2 type transport system ATP-binding protein